MTDRVNYSDTVRKFIVVNFLFGDKGKLTNDTPLFQAGIIDSTGILELVAFIEDNFKVTVKEDEMILDNFSTLSSIENFLLNKIKDSPPGVSAETR